MQNSELTTAARPNVEMMKIVFIYGQPAVGKLTVARELAALTGFSLFHNHVMVDAIASVFPFGSGPFIRLREQFWTTMFREAGEAGQSLIFTFCPEAIVSPDFPYKVRDTIESIGGETIFVRLTLSIAEQERRIGSIDRAEFNKLRSLALLRRIRDELSECEAAMPPAAMTIDTACVEPRMLARMIADTFSLPLTSTSGNWSPECRLLNVKKSGVVASFKGFLIY
jgi:hypothetical protein